MTELRHGHPRTGAGQGKHFVIARYGEVTPGGAA